ncbi:MAG TPA: hypothetical protein VF461_21085 [Gemmatimonadaceae bacterium]
MFRLIPFAASVALAAMAACVNETGAITVSPGFEIGVTPDNPTIALGDSVALAVTLPSTLQASGASFTSANTAVAIARPNGWIIGVGRGRTNITVTAVADTKLSTSVSVLVGP